MAKNDVDFRNFGEDGPIEDGRKGVSPRWWECATGDEAAQAVSNTLTLLDAARVARQQIHVRDARLYGNVAQLGFFNGTGYAGATQTPLAGTVRERLSYNLVASVIDTLSSRVGKNRPKPMFLTNGGNYREKRKAKKLNKFCDGIFFDNAAYEVGSTAFRDACVWGDGIVKVFAKHDKVRWERVMPGEIVVDELEGFYGKPRQMHHVRDVDKSVLIAAFPKKAQVIRDANDSSSMAATPDVVADLVTVRESWHLPSAPGAKDGKHILTIDGHALAPADEWEHDFFPFARFSYAPSLYGVWARGAAERLAPMQIELNRLLAVIQRSSQLAGTLKVAMERGSKIVKSQITNELGGQIDYTGKPPIFFVPPIVPPELYTQVADIIRRGYEQEGVSMMAAQSQKPAGLDSGKALRTFNDIESDRFASLGRRYENFYLELARLSVETAKGIAKKNNGSYAVKTPGRGQFSTVDWKDINLNTEDMQCFAVSSLPSDPAGRMQTVQEYMQAGLITPRQGKRLLDFPDLQAEETLSNAAEEYLEKILDAIVDEGVYTAPEPLDDLKLAREMALEMYQYGKCQDLEPERLALLITFLDQIDEIEKELADKLAAQQAKMAMQTQALSGAGAPAPGGAPPMAVPTAPPVSALLPNVPAPAAVQ